MDGITEQLSQLQELADEQISELENSVLAEFENTEKQDLTPQVVDKLEQLANAVEAIRTEKSRRVAAMEALTQKAAEAVSRVRPADDSQKDVNPDPEGLPPEQPGDTPAPTPAPGDPSSTPVPQEQDKLKPKGPVFSEDESKAAELSATPAAEAPAAPAAPAEQTVQTPAPAEAAAPTTPVTQATTEAPPESEASAKENEKKETVKDDEKDEGSVKGSEASSDEQTTEAKTSTDAEAAGVSENTTVEAPATAINTENTPEAQVTAAAPGTGDSLQIEPPADRKPIPKSPAATLSITAGADIPGVSAGAKFDDMLSVAEGFAKRLHSLRHVHGGDGEQHIVASLQNEFPEERLLGTTDTQENTDKIHGVTSPEALTAAAGICLPLETRYDLGCDIGVTDRPIRDSLARFGADRGGIRFFTAPTLAQEAAATGFWRGDVAGQNWHTYGPDGTTATTPADQKPCLEVQCTTERTAFIEAVTLCLTFNNLTTRTFPELIKRHNELALVAHSRIAENHLLAMLEAGSTAIQARKQVVGAAREIFNLLGLAVATYRFNNRMNSVSPLRMLAPLWVLDLLRADLALQMPGDGMENTLGVAEAQINSWFRARGVNITWHLDGVGPALGDVDTVTTGTQTGFLWPSTLKFGLWAEGTWLYLDGGTLDLGVIRDSSLVATNQYKQFVESFEGLANMGCESYWVSATVCPTGAAAGLVNSTC